MKDRMLRLRTPEADSLRIFPVSMSGFFSDILNDFETNNITQRLSPHMDMQETEDEIMVSAELPGMDEKDIEVNVSSHGYLTIKGEKKQEKEDKAHGKYLSERSYGRIERTLSLPVDVNADKTTAVFEKGVLKVCIPKSEAAKEKIKKVAIKA